MIMGGVQWKSNGHGIAMTIMIIVDIIENGLENETEIGITIYSYHKWPRSNSIPKFQLHK